MRFSELNENDWLNLAPYMDTCLIPVSGLTGDENPAQAKEAVAACGDWLAPVEHAFRGRTVTMPAYHYYDGSPQEATCLNDLCDRMRSSGFHYVVLIAGKPGLLFAGLKADLLLQPLAAEDEPDIDAIRAAVAVLWKASSFSGKG